MSNDTETLTLTDFLLARIEEDEEAAGAERLRYVPPLTRERWVNLDDGARVTTAAEAGVVTRRMAECEAKRQIVELHQYVGLKCRECRAGDEACPTKRVLAIVYAVHPGYDPDWRP